MKICPKCGAKYQNHRTYCVDCNEYLGKPISAKEEKQARAEMDEQLETLYNGGDPLYVSKADMLGGVIAILLGLALAVFALVTGMSKEFPMLLWIGGVIALVCGLEAFCPRLSWELEKWRLSLSVDGTDGLTPSDFYRMTRKVVIWGGAILAAIMLLTEIYAVTAVYTA